MPVELGFTVILALKKTFRLPNESSEPDPKGKFLWKLSKFTLADRLENIFEKIKLKENKYSYRFRHYYQKEDWQDMYDVDISGLELNTAIYIGDLELPDGITVLSDPQEMVAQIVHERLAEEEEEEEEALIVEEEGEVEVIGRGRADLEEEEEN